MTTAEILQEWLKYTEYDPQKNTYNVFSTEYAYRKCCDHIKDFLEYDPTGAFCVLYAKQQFCEILKQVKVSAFSVVSDPAYFSEEVAMWKLFQSDDVAQIEKEVLDSFDALICKVVPTKMLGNRDKEAEKNTLLQSVEAVVEQLKGCNTDLHLRGGQMEPVTNFSTKIHVFPRLAECLVAIEQAADGIYLCYIRCGDGADGYFTFIIKSNGNIISVNERINETYPGEHSRHRNHRWAENKRFALFPYNAVISHTAPDSEAGADEKTDYKGYFTEYYIDEDKLAFFNLQPSAYQPLVLAMLLLSRRFANYDTADMQIQYVDSLFPVNLSLPAPGQTALIVPGNSMVARVNKELPVAFDGKAVTDGSQLDLIGKDYAKSDFSKDFYHYEYDEEQLFVQLYGDGFELDTTTLLESNQHLKRLSSTQLAKEQVVHPEFVGSQERMKAVAYKNGREQLAKYIRQKMREEYLAFGGSAAMHQWWEKMLNENKQKILQMCADRYAKGNTYKWTDAKKENTFYIDMRDDHKVKPNWTACCGPGYPLNEHRYYKSGYLDYNTALCPITGQCASHYFLFQLTNWQEIAQLVGEENVPKILKGYKKHGHLGYTNPILDIHDPVSFIGTPFEQHEVDTNQMWWTKDRWESYFFHKGMGFGHKAPEDALKQRSVMDFYFAVGISKRGMARLLKERNSFE